MNQMNNAAQSSSVTENTKNNMQAAVDDLANKIVLASNSIYKSSKVKGQSVTENADGSVDVMPNMLACDKIEDSSHPV